MVYIIVCLILLWIVYSIARWFQRRRIERAELFGGSGQLSKKGAVPYEPPTDACCGRHAICARDFLKQQRQPSYNALVYYNDEELDVYRNVVPENYSEQALNEFREVLYTLQDTEIQGWLDSLQQRGINLPLQLKDEALFIINDKQ